jgi:hypothetical protein
MVGMSRPSSLTAERRETIEQALGAGAPIDVAAASAGVSARSVSHWLQDGSVVRRELTPAPEPIGEEVPLTERLAQAEPGLVAAVITAAQRGRWMAAAGILERAWPERWARPGRRDELPPEPLADDPFREVDELAERRRKR